MAKQQFWNPNCEKCFDFWYVIHEHTNQHDIHSMMSLRVAMLTNLEKLGGSKSKPLNNCPWISLLTATNLLQRFLLQDSKLSWKPPLIGITTKDRDSKVKLLRIPEQIQYPNLKIFRIAEVHGIRSWKPYPVSVPASWLPTLANHHLFTQDEDGCSPNVMDATLAGWILWWSPNSNIPWPCSESQHSWSARTRRSTCAEVVLCCVVVY